MRARMRSPRCICSLCSGVYAGDDFFDDLGLRVGVLTLSAFLIPFLRARHGGDARMTSPPLPPDIRCLFASLWAWRIEGNPSEGISFMKLQWGAPNASAPSR